MIKVFTMEIPQLYTKRKIRMYLPKNYKTANKRYPVLYMHDGQNLFDGKLSVSKNGWQIQDLLQELNEEIIVVGIDNGMKYRYAEYSPWDSTIEHVMANVVSARGDKYAAFINDTLKPFIDEHYPTLSDADNTAICGSSMGGVISLYTTLAYQETFGAAGCLSIASWTSRDSMMSFIDKESYQGEVKFYVSVGDSEGHNPKMIPDLAKQYVDDYEVISNKLIEKGFNVKKELFEGYQHSEIYWREPFKQFIRFWRNK